ncbi:hypothetical protein [Mycobacterium sp. 360MFTsu5.1]|uniref:hypothetical protein n=1 Tax=Mycobacterium sp. 360MFTsu5.1 TaxID=1172186 RepID=UPI00036306D5|nr:hypothetical protein [Mycobacterium sp. 360MFTsu5.1]
MAVESVLPDQHVATDGARGAAPTTTPTPSLIDPAVLSEIDADTVDPDERGIVSTLLFANKLVDILAQVVTRFRRKTDHGVYPTVVEEILRAFYLGNVDGSIWAAMKDQTAAALGEDRGARLLFDGIAAAEDDSSYPRIMLVGHSAGGVFIDNFIAELARGHTRGYRQWPESPRFRVALLAPANTYTSFASTLATADRYIEYLRMFTMPDDAEQQDRLAGAFYPRSLLYFVSGVLERDQSGGSIVAPLTGLARYLDATSKKPRSLVGTRDYLAGRVVLSPTAAGAAPGRAAAANTHGDFDDDALVLNSVQEMIREWR